jgi:DNA-binding transcriptional LysR family regulator
MNNPSFSRRTSLRHLRSFMAVADLNSLSQAAKALFVTPSALSLTIQHLEEDLGLKLFDRTTRRMELTSAGAELLPAAERLLRQFDETLRDMRALSSLQEGHVRVAAVPSMVTLLLPRAAKSFMQVNAGIKVALMEEPARGVHAAVLGGKADFGITSIWRSSSELQFEPLFDDRYVVLFAEGHPLGERSKSVSWEAVSEFPIVAFGADPPLRDQLASQPVALSRIKMPAHRASEASAIEAMVREGLAIAVMPALSAQRPPLTRLKRKLVHGPICTRTVGILSRRGRSASPAASALMALIRSEVASLECNPKIDICRAADPEP